MQKSTIPFNIFLFAVFEKKSDFVGSSWLLGEHPGRPIGLLPTSDNVHLMDWRHTIDLGSRKK